MFPPGIELKLKTTEAPDMRLVMLSRPENVALVRQALSGLADALELDDAVVGDMKGAVSEACNNVVVHAYDGKPGMLEVYMCPDGEDFDIIVRDAGRGVRPNPPEPGADIQGVGLSLIQALTDRVEFSGVPGEGTEVRMGFHTPNIVMPTATLGRESAEQVIPPAGDAVVSVAVGPLAGPVLSRVMGMVAARSGFSIDRLADVQLLSDAIAAHAPDAIVGRHIHVGMDDEDTALRLRVGPLEAGGAQRMIQASAIGGMPSLIEQLVDGLEVASNSHSEQLLLRMADAG
jgi:anti-sigma regulatory factor (Ser/Thr protein kinase)